MLKEERKALRDEFERIYGIHLREDDELLPIIQFITEASKLAQLNADESKKILEDMKVSQAKLFEQIVQNYKAIIDNTRKDLSGLPQILTDLKKAVGSIPKIPDEVRINQVRTFESQTTSFLWRYFLVSGLAIMLALFFAAYTWREKERIIIQYRPSEASWLRQYYDHMQTEAPSATKKFTDRNPFPEN